MLTCEVTYAEIRSAVFEIKSSSAPGKDGMSGVFFSNTSILLGRRSQMRLNFFFAVENFQSNGTSLRFSLS